MQNSLFACLKGSIRRSTAVSLAVSTLVLGGLDARAATVDVNLDPALTWNGYESVYTNGLVNTTWPAYISGYVGSGNSLPIQASIDAVGTVVCAPDIRPDQLFPTDTLIWADASGTSSAIGKAISSYYAESTTIAGAGDTVNFSATLATNSLVAPYKDTIIAFVKDFDASYGFKGMSSVSLNTLTNGQPFTVTYAGIAAAGDHVQWGFEWAGPPARAATVASLGSIAISSNTVAGPTPKEVHVYIDPSMGWNGYRNLYHEDTTYWRGDYFAPGSAGVAALQGSINNDGTVRCAPDISMDTDFHFDTTAWADASGTSAGICRVGSTFYIDTTTSGANAGDIVTFTGTLVTNGLAEPYTNSIVAFIKDFTPTWGWNGMASVNLNTLTNGQQFSVSKVIVGTGDHVQWGFEWSGPPARTNTVADLGYAILSSNSVVSTGPRILSINPSAAKVIAGSNVSFTATVTGTGLSYQWKKDGINLANGGGISGATTNSLALNGVACAQEGAYSLVVTDSGGLKATNSVSLLVFNPGWLNFDPALAPFEGYINAFDVSITSPPASGSGGTVVGSLTGFGVNPTTLLRAHLNNGVITLQPNTYVYDNATNTSDPFWIQADGTANKYLEQDYFISADFLSGQTLTFAGYCSSNSLNPAYTAVAWIKDLDPNWSRERRYDAPLVAGKPFSLTVSTIAGNHIQYGFGLFGPDNSATNPITQGAVEIKAYSPFAATRSGGNVNLTFPTLINHHYIVQYKTNLTDSVWSNFGTNAGSGDFLTVPDATGAKQRFYRLLIQ